MQAHHPNAPWHMGGTEWIELAAFWTLAMLVFGILIGLAIRRPTTARDTRPSRIGALRWPEIQLVILALPLELLWEIAQFPLYDVWHQNDWGYILYGLAHCTLGDLLILLVIYEMLALLNRNRHWYRGGAIWINGALFTLLGVGYTIFSEIMNVRIKGTWGYTELMPIVPGLEIGGTPFLQWLLIPPVLLWLMRGASPLRQANN